MLNMVDPEPIEFWLPLVALFAISSAVLVSYSARRRVLTDERQFVTDYLLFGRLCWWHRRWQVRKGDFLVVFATGQAQYTRLPELHFRHTLFVCRSRRRQMIAGIFASDRVAPGMDFAAQRIAKLVDIPYKSYGES